VHGGEGDADHRRHIDGEGPTDEARSIDTAPEKKDEGEAAERRPERGEPEQLGQRVNATLFEVVGLTQHP
jgi:hypothetical protein